MKALGEHGFPVPRAVDQNRHAVLMSMVDAQPLVQVRPRGAQARTKHGQLAAVPLKPPAPAPVRPPPPPRPPPPAPGTYLDEEDVVAASSEKRDDGLTYCERREGGGGRAPRGAHASTPARPPNLLCRRPRRPRGPLQTRAGPTHNPTPTPPHPTPPQTPMRSTQRMAPMAPTPCPAAPSRRARGPGPVGTLGGGQLAASPGAARRDGR
jgi:hypothetical protein